MKAYKAPDTPRNDTRKNVFSFCPQKAQGLAEELQVKRHEGLNKVSVMIWEHRGLALNSAWWARSGIRKTFWRKLKRDRMGGLP